MRLLLCTTIFGFVTSFASASEKVVQDIKIAKPKEDLRVALHDLDKDLHDIVGYLRSSDSNKAGVETKIDFVFEDGLTGIKDDLHQNIQSTELKSVAHQEQEACADDSSWQDGDEVAPIIITNFPVFEEKDYMGNHKHDYIYQKNWGYPDEPWRVLTNVKWIDGYTTNWKVTKTNEDEAHGIITNLFTETKKDIMFFIHGWNSGARSAICTTQVLNERLKNYVVIPLIWNTDRGLAQAADYRHDRVVTASKASMSLANLYNTLFRKLTCKKNWVCHSMGCYVTQYFAQEVNPDQSDALFQNLIMVAPDVRYDLFNEWPMDSGKDRNQCRDDEWNDVRDNWRIPDCRMGGGVALTELYGHVDVFWNANDMALFVKEVRLSAFMVHEWPISIKALGKYGDSGHEGRFPKDMFSGKVNFTQVHPELTDDDSHGYFLSDQLIQAYQAANV